MMPARWWDVAATVAAAAMIAALVVGCGARIDADAGASDPPDDAPDIHGVVDIGGDRWMFVTCRGTGSPTVFLLSGRGNGADDWMQVLEPGDPVHDAPGDDLSTGAGTLIAADEAVFPSLARDTRVCAYDRPDIRTGDDATTPRPQPHTVDVDVRDLHDLAAAIGETGPKVLVAHSYSGFIALLYARLHPAEVAGLVMVDAGSEQMARVVSDVALQTWDADNATVSESVREGVRLADAIDRIDAAGPPPEVPAVVLVADKPWRTDLLPPELRERESVAFEDWQAQLALLADVLDAPLVSDTASGHAVYLYNPALVVDAVRRVVDEVRARS